MDSMLYAGYVLMPMFYKRVLDMDLPEIPEAAWDAAVEVRDAAPRVPDDVDTYAILIAAWPYLYASALRHVANLWEESMVDKNCLPFHCDLDKSTALTFVPYMLRVQADGAENEAD
jgi:hypothetical protein